MIEIKPVAFVHSERTEVSDDNWSGESVIELADWIPADALDGVSDFSHLEILFHFHKADPAKIKIGPSHPRNNPDWPKVGIFARRGKNRPNHLGLTVVKLIAIEGKKLRVAGLDALDGTPVIDIKPLMRGFLPREELTEPKWSEEIMSRYWK